MELPNKTTLPKDLTRKVSSEINFNPLKQLFIAINRVTPNTVYPTNLALKKTHKIIMSTESTKPLEGPNGDKNQYIGVISFGLWVEYYERTITSQRMRGLDGRLKVDELKIATYTAIFPLKSWDNMFWRAIGQSYSAYHPNVIEVHFSKLNQYKYLLKFLAIVEWNEEKKEFERKIIEYKDLGYKL